MLDTGIHLYCGKNRAFWGRKQLRMIFAKTIQNIFHKIGGGCFSLGSGQTNQAEIAVRLTIKRNRGKAHRFADIADNQAGNGICVPLFGKICPRSFFNGI